MATFRSNGYTEYPNNPVNTVGKKLRTVPFQATIATASISNGDVWILGGPFTYDSKIVGILGLTPALTSAADNDFGFYKGNADGTFTELDKDVLVDGVSLASAGAFRNILASGTADRDDNIGTLLGKTVEDLPVEGVYLAMTMNTKSTATSEVLDLLILVEEATTK